MAIKIVHHRDGCIGCGACCATAPKFWKMGEDGKSELKDAKKIDDGMYERIIDAKDKEVNKDAAESCPVNVIHIIIDGKQEV